MQPNQSGDPRPEKVGSRLRRLVTSSEVVQSERCQGGTVRRRKTPSGPPLQNSSRAPMATPPHVQNLGAQHGVANRWYRMATRLRQAGSRQRLGGCPCGPHCGGSRCSSSWRAKPGLCWHGGGGSGSGHSTGHSFVLSGHKMISYAIAIFNQDIR